MSEVIRNCPWGYKCDKQWLDLNETANSNIRFCTDCQRDVHWVDNAEQLASAVADDLCVSFSTLLIKPLHRTEPDNLQTTGRPFDTDSFEPWLAD